MYRVFMFNIRIKKLITFMQNSCTWLLFYKTEQVNHGASSDEMDATDTTRSARSIVLPEEILLWQVPWQQVW